MLSRIDGWNNYLMYSDHINIWENPILIQRPKYPWEFVQIGNCGSPIETEKGWLAVYHGADASHRYCLGAFLLDLNDPTIVISRTEEPIMVPTEKYETSGFFGDVVFTNGHIVCGDRLTIYYGASDEFVCGADFSISEILSILS